ncbi:MAG: DUF2255 family protein [Saprospiraceae bacterium]|nr:DUF2255 family protein [Saprospiraceae bacterium]
MLTNEEIKKFAAADDFHIAPYREDGITTGTPTWIWSVMVRDQLFVRAYHGAHSKWYQAALKQKAGKIEGAGLVKTVEFAPVTGTILEEIDEAYRRKYSKSPYLSSMINAQAKAATMRVI